MSSVKCTNSVAPLGVRVKVSKWLKENWLLVGAAGAGALLLQQSHRKSIDEINAKYEVKHAELKTKHDGDRLITEQNILLMQELDELGKTAYANFTDLFQLRRTARSKVRNSVTNSHIISQMINRVKAKVEENPNLANRVLGTHAGGLGLSRTYGTIGDEVENLSDLLNTSHGFFDPDELFYDGEMSYLYAGHLMYVLAPIHSLILHGPGNKLTSYRPHLYGELVDIGWDTTPTYSKLMWYLNKSRHLNDPALASMSPEDLNATLNEMTRAIKYVSPKEADSIKGLNDVLSSNSQLAYFLQRKKDGVDDWKAIVYDLYGSANYEKRTWDGETDHTGQPRFQQGQLDIYKLSNSPRLTAFFEQNPAVQ